MEFSSGSFSIYTIAFIKVVVRIEPITYALINKWQQKQRSTPGIQLINSFSIEVVLETLEIEQQSSFMSGRC